MISLLRRAFPRFSPSDLDAAMVFCLDVAICHNQANMIMQLIDPASNLGGVEGDPGWIIEKRRDKNSPEYYDSWPTWAAYRVFLDPQAFEVDHPEYYAIEDEFLRCWETLLSAYSRELGHRKDGP